MDVFLRAWAGNFLVSPSSRPPLQATNNSVIDSSVLLCDNEWGCPIQVQEPSVLSLNKQHLFASTD